LDEFRKQQQIPSRLDWREERRKFQHRMSCAGAFVRVQSEVEKALSEARTQYRILCADGLGGLSPDALAESLRNRQLCLAQIYYLESIRIQTLEIGSRGGSIVLSEKGEKIHPKLSEKWRIEPENLSQRKRIMVCSSGADEMPSVDWEDCRPVPEPDGWFETVWKNCREGKLHEN